MAITGIDYRNAIFEGNRTVLTSGVNMIAAELSLLLNFKKYSLFFGNEMGLDCEKYIGLTNRTATFNLIKADIEALISKYGRVSLKTVEMTFNEETNAIDVVVVVSLRQGGGNLSLPFTISN